MLRDCDIAQIDTNKLKTSDLIQQCKNRRGAGAKPVFDIEASYKIFDEAVPVLTVKLVSRLLILLSLVF
jgi:hypothetical protein